MALTLIARCHLASGEYDQARRVFEDVIAVSRPAGERRAHAHALEGLGHVAYARSQFAEARDFYNQSLRMRREIDFKFGFPPILEAKARLAAVDRGIRRAALLLGAAHALRESLHTPIPPAERAERDRCLETTRAALGEADFTESWEIGRAMTLTEATTLALQD